MLANLLMPTQGQEGMSDWLEACDPVPARRELTEAQKRQRVRVLERVRADQGRRRVDPEGPAYVVDSDFDDMGA